MIVDFLARRLGMRRGRRDKARSHVGVLRPVDARPLARIHAEGFARAWDTHDFERMLADPAMVADGAFVGQSPVPIGFIMSRRVLDEAEILTIAVARRQQGRGLARQLLATHLARLASIGVTTLFLEVEEGNQPATSLYRAFGFEETGRREAYYTKPDGRRVAALTMKKALAG
jgi:ribosomal-protein-alanine N-acetyltransferase